MDITRALLAANLVLSVLLLVACYLSRRSAAEARRQLERLKDEKYEEVAELGGRISFLCLLVLWGRLKGLPREKRHVVISAALKPFHDLNRAAEELRMSQDEIRELIYGDKDAWTYPEL
jgi:hypothetical protein